ncbi:hypothetical protein KUH03_12365 [Sphingobacterium sp. E70]|uniref:sugar phosphate isomerase/epimerase family protein n=1 Tax=Sphingobacterium sp. E70 TaxID=2853439 RepID=UPI00211B87AD|nr:hypothetical protein [Sphingobacterium sp. E70]ULT27462.1 hypothetical protein KUH03_12365 [Sphingobacterium sp. E70]
MGLKVAYHNHFWEFRDLGNNTTGEDVMLAFTEPDLVDFELDLFWAEKAGKNPISIFEKFPNRFKLWHVKDMDRTKSNPIEWPKDGKLPVEQIFKDIRYTEVGTGSISFPEIVKEKTKAGLKYAFVEQDDIYMPNKMESLKKATITFRQILSNKKGSNASFLFDKILLELCILYFDRSFNHFTG